MRNFFTLFMVMFGATGCASMISNLPSVQNCDEVTYRRVGNLVRIEADCRIPMQSSPLLNVPGLP